MSAITCPAGSANCGTISNCLLPTTISANVYTGLTAVNVNEAQDWRVYYLDKNGAVSQLEGNNSGFAMGEQIGGSGLNASSLAAVNINSTTNDINLFYVDDLTRNLFKMQFTNGAWTTRESLPLPLTSTLKSPQHQQYLLLLFHPGTHILASALHIAPRKINCMSITLVSISAFTSSSAQTPHRPRIQAGYRIQDATMSGLPPTMPALISLPWGGRKMYASTK